MEFSFCPKNLVIKALSHSYMIVMVISLEIKSVWDIYKLLKRQDRC